MRTLAPFVVMVALLPRPVHAQAASTSFDELRSRLKPGDTVYVSEMDGRLTRGKLGELSASSLELLVPEKRADGREVLVPKPRLSERDIREIQRERHDPILNGLLIGLGAGAASGAWGAVEECRWDNCGSARTRTIAGNTAMFAAIGAGIGAWIDWLRSSNERVTVYLAAANRSSRGRMFAPLSASGGLGISIQV